MAPRQGNRGVERGRTAREVTHPNAAGIDLGCDGSYVAVPPDRDAQPVRRFGCYTPDLEALADWLAACGVDTVAMESTGVYWVPLMQVLERRGFEVYLVNARHAKNVPGRKTDVSDCQWLQELHSYGLLAASFRPADEICVLRSYWRHRSSLIERAAAEVQHMHKALEQMNVQLHKAVSDVTGVTGMRIIDAILDGQRDPVALAALKDARARTSAAELAQALKGDWREEHLFVLGQAVASYRFHHQQVAACDAAIEAYLNRLEAPRAPGQPPWSANDAPPTSAKRVQGHAPAFDLGSHQQRLTGVDFTVLAGMSVLTVQTILSEVGLDPSRFGTTARFCSWLGLCPANRITGDKVHSSRTRRVANPAATAFRLAAVAAGKTQGPIGQFYRRLRARLGAPKAVTATAHKLARLFFALWRDQRAFDPAMMDRHEQRNHQRRLRHLARSAHALGFQLVPLDAETAA